MGEFFCHDPLKNRPELFVGDGFRALGDHLAIPLLQDRGAFREGGKLRKRGRRAGNPPQGKENVPDDRPLSQSIELADNVRLQEGKLLHPDRGGNRDEERFSLEVAGAGLGGDLGADGPVPEGEYSSLLQIDGNFPLLQGFLKDLAEGFRFFEGGSPAHAFPLRTDPGSGQEAPRPDLAQGKQPITTYFYTTFERCSIWNWRK